MARKVTHKQHVQKTGNILRTVLIWVGFLLALAAGFTLMFSEGNQKVALMMMAVGMVSYGFALRDFDVDDDD